MSLYVVVEGRRTEPKLYRAWLPFLFPGIVQAARIEDATSGHFFLVAGHGYPSYLTRIRNAVADIQMAESPFTHLLVCVDAEEESHDDRLGEISDVIEDADCPIDYTVIVADCCIETWLLGNQKFIKRSPEDPRLREYLQHFDVKVEDPELIPKLPPHRTRAALCVDYLKATFRERGLAYSKHDPAPATTRPYFQALRDRARPAPEGPGHLRSFARLLELRDKVQLT